MAIRKNLKRGFTLVELMIVVAIVGILAALAIYGVRRYVTNAKTTEARNSLGMLAKAAAAAYNSESMPGAVLALGANAGASNALCWAGSMASVPSALTSVQGKKYQSSPAEWTAGSASQGWACIRFGMEEPQYFMYDYVSSGGTRTAMAANSASFTALAHGDLDGDGTGSTFSIGGALDNSGGSMAVKVSPSITEVSADE